MSGTVPTKPGWYPDPRGPKSLRYWDGRYWTGRARLQPPWAVNAASFDVPGEEWDRSVEGPVHPHELKEPVASGAWSREWLAWRPRQAGGGWHRAPQPRQAPRPPRKAPAPPNLSPSRRPLLALVCLLVVAIGVVISSVAFISPYETRSTAQARDELAAVRFAAQVDKACAASLTKYRSELAWGVDGPTIEAAAAGVEQLGQRVARMDAPADVRGPLTEWLTTLDEFSADQSHYASIIGPATRLSGGRFMARALPADEQVLAAQVRQQATDLAARADIVSATLQLPACRLEPVPAG